MESGNHKTGVVVIAVIAGLVIGGLGGWWIGDMKSTTLNSSSSKSGGMQVNQQDGTMVGGALMVKDKDIVDNAVNAKNVTTLVDLVKKADLVETLKGEGPFTVFAPNNDAFAKLDAATVESLQKPENKKMLQDILTYHVVPGTYTSAALKVMAEKGEMLTSVQGEMLIPVMQDNMVMIKDAKGGMVKVQTPDVISSNGVTHVVESVLMPKD